MRSAFTILTVLATAACSHEFVAPPTPPTTPIVVAGIGKVSGAQGFYPIVYTTGPGTITADGTYPYQSLCDRNFVFSGYLSQGWIALQVRDTTTFGTGSNCQPTPLFWSWHAEVQSLAPGTYIVDAQFPDFNGHYASFQTDTVVVP